MIRIAASIIIILLVAATATATIYKWVDEKGTTHYSESPPPKPKIQAKEVEIAPSTPKPTLPDTSKPAIRGTLKPAVQLQIPNLVGTGQLVPVDVTVYSVLADDPIKDISIVVKSNPTLHMHALKIRFLEVLPPYVIKTRVRMTGDNRTGMLDAVVNTKSGQTIKKTSYCKINKGFNYNDIRKSRVKPGQAFAEVRKEKNDLIEIMGRISHPMLPARGYEKPWHINNIKIYYRNRLVAVIESSDALATHPFFVVGFKDGKPGIGEVRVIWTDTRDNIYEARATES